MSKKIISAVSAVLAITITGTTAFAEESHMMDVKIKGMEKCYGIAKAGQNDCHTTSHSCSGASKINNDKEEWVLVPTGLCKKIAGSSLTAPNTAKS